MNTTRILVLSMLVLGSASARAFTVKTGLTPIGHESLTIKAAGYAAYTGAAGEFDAIAQRQTATEWRTAGCSGCEKYGAPNHKVLSTVIGTRWVDLKGFELNAKVHHDNIRCWHAVAVHDDMVQHDHALRKRQDSSATGWSTAVNGAKARFQQYFKDAAKTPIADTLDVIEGGEIRQKYRVNKAYFLFGKALHLLQDSFSPEHVTRSKGSNTITDVRTQICTPNASHHGNDNGVSLHRGGACSRLNVYNGDVVWQPGKEGDDDTNLREWAAVALDASRDLWSAFLYVRGLVANPTNLTDAQINSALNPVIDKWFQMATANPSTDGRLWGEIIGCGMNEDDFCADRTSTVVAGQRTACYNVVQKETETVAGDSVDRPKYVWGYDRIELTEVCAVGPDLFARSKPETNRRGFMCDGQTIANAWTNFYETGFSCKEAAGQSAEWVAHHLPLGSFAHCGHEFLHGFFAGVCSKIGLAADILRSAATAASQTEACYALGAVGAGVGAGATPAGAVVVGGGAFLMCGLAASGWKKARLIYSCFEELSAANLTGGNLKWKNIMGAIWTVVKESACDVAGALAFELFFAALTAGAGGASALHKVLHWFESNVNDALPRLLGVHGHGLGARLKGLGINGLADFVVSIGNTFSSSSACKKLLTE